MVKRSLTIQNQSNMVITANNLVVNAWKNAETSPDPLAIHKDFKQLNKLSTKNGFHTAKVFFYLFRNKLS